MTLLVFLCIGLLAVSAVSAQKNYRMFAWCSSFIALPPLLVVMPTVKAVFIWLALLSLVFMLVVVIWGMKRT